MNTTMRNIGITLIGVVILITVLSSLDEKEEVDDAEFEPDVPDIISSPFVEFNFSDVYQSDIGLWNADLGIHRVPSDRLYNISETVFVLFDREGNRLDASNIGYVDADSDGFVSSPDKVLLTNLTEGFLGATINVTCGGKGIGTSMMKWGSNDAHNYLVWLGLKKVAWSSEGTWNMTLSINFVRGNLSIDAESTSYGIVSPNGVVLTSADITFVDNDGNDILSTADHIKIVGVSERYLHAKLQISARENLIGFTELTWDTDIE